MTMGTAASVLKVGDAIHATGRGAASPTVAWVPHSFVYARVPTAIGNVRMQAFFRRECPTDGRLRTILAQQPVGTLRA